MCHLVMDASASVQRMAYQLLQEAAKKHNATPGQLALAWLLAQGPDVIPIPGYVWSMIEIRGMLTCAQYNQDCEP